MKRSKQRGAAAVETAILMVVLIPLIMYSAFLGDLLTYRLDQDEAVYSSPWDFAAWDYRHVDQILTSDYDPANEKANSSDTSVTGLMNKWNRITYADHSSANNTYSDWNYDANDSAHHQAATAHECWLAQGGEQINCKIETTNGREPGEIDPMFSSLTKGNTIASRHAGGMTVCRARLGVQNYFLPQQFMQWWAKNDMAATNNLGQHFASEGDHAGDIHANAKTDAYKFPEGMFSVLHDSWALNYVRDGKAGTYPKDRTAAHVTVDPKDHPNNLGNDELSRWMRVPFNGPFGSNTVLLTLRPAIFVKQAVSDGFLYPGVAIDATGDMLSTPPVAFNPAKDAKFRESYPSGWGDSRASGMQGTGKADYMRKSPSSW